jgi:hypothetical protein
MTRIRLLVVGSVALAALSAFTSGCSLFDGTQGFCQAAFDCTKGDLVHALDTVGQQADDVSVCVNEKESELSALRANSEDVCVKLADALNSYYGCVGSQAGKGDACTGFVIENPFTNDQNACQTELANVNDLRNRAASHCDANETESGQ